MPTTMLTNPRCRISTDLATRPGTESDGLRWCDLERFAHRPDGPDARLLEDPGAEWLELGLKGSGIDHRPLDGGQLYSLEITVRGKTGIRKLVPTRCCQFPFFVLRVLREGHLRQPVNPKERVFCLPDGTFQSADSLRQLFKPMLQEAGCSTTPTGGSARCTRCAIPVKRHRELGSSAHSVQAGLRR